MKSRTSPSASCDVAIIGGGPAGTSAATLLRQKGYHVVLLEKQVHPRYHVGESLIPHFWRYCDLLGVGDRIRAEGFLEKAGGTVVWNNRIQQVSFADFDFREKALHVERDRFDQILFEHAVEQGTEAFERVSVTGVDFDGAWQHVHWRHTEDGTTGQTRCRFVLDASGQGAVVARQLGLRELDPDFRFVSLWGYARNAKYVALDGRAYSFDQARVTPPTTFVSALGTDNDSWSWLWHITLRKTTSLGLVVTLDELAEAKRSFDSLETYFQHTCRTTPIVGQLLDEATFEGDFRVIRDFSYRATRPAGAGYFLLGDAATFIDPIFSQGLVLAFYTANLAAWSVDRCLRNPEGTARHQELYAQQVQMRAEMARSMALPGYSSSALGQDGRQAVQLESKVEQRLMHVVAGLTNRSQNFRNLIQTDTPPEPSEVRTLTQIEF